MQEQLFKTKTVRSLLLEDSVITDIGIDVDYTAFEVFPTNVDIPAEDGDTYVVDSNDPDDEHSVAKIFNFNNTTATGLRYKELVPAQMHCVFDIRFHDKESLIIDWGDDVIETYTIDDATSVEPSEVKYVVVHEYQKPGKYIVKIYGNCHQIRNTNYANNKSADPTIPLPEGKYRPIISRLFDCDLPVSSKLLNVSSLCYANKHLLKIDVPEYYKINLRNITSMFLYCYNLQKVAINKFSEFTTNIFGTCNSLFNMCKNLEESNFRLPLCSTPYISSSDNSNGYGCFYYGCIKLKSKIEDLIPYNGFICPYNSFYLTFGECSSLIGDVNSNKASGNVKRVPVADVLWNSKHNEDYNTLNNAFRGCSPELRAQIPTSWGGTKPL